MRRLNDVIVLIDQASLVRLDRPAAEIVVGNPSIADVSVQSGKVLIVTGKSFGETNLIVIDADGKMIINRRLIVQEPRTGFVTVYRGACAADPALRALLRAGTHDRRRARCFQFCLRSDHDQAVDRPNRSGRRQAVIRRQCATRSSEMSWPMALNADRSSLLVPGAKYLSLSEAQL